MTSPQLFERDQEEVRRSTEEAKKTVLRQAEVDRYLKPPSNTAYPLEYAFYLLGDARGKNILDLGCGTGENIIALTKHGADRVVGMDVSPELIALAEQRIKRTGAGAKATVKIGSAYDTSLPSESVDVIFCIALIHHLDIAAVRNEMHRILTKNGSIVLSEPTRFSPSYARLRNLLPEREDISDYEHPLTEDELALFTKYFDVEEKRYFRTPLLPLLARVLPFDVFEHRGFWKMDYQILRHFPIARKYATNVTVRLRKVK